MLMVSGMKTRFHLCDSVFWMMMVAVTTLLIGMSCKCALRMHREYLREQQTTVASRSISNSKSSSSKKPKYRESTSFFQSPTKSVKLVAQAYFAGILASLCGIGGGMLLGPTMLSMGLRPQITSATTATTLFMLSTTASLIFVSSGAAPVEYSAVLCFVTCCGALGGKIVISNYVKRTNRTSAIVFILGVIIILSTFMLVGIGVRNFIGHVYQAYWLHNADAKKELWFRLPECSGGGHGGGGQH